MRDKTGIFPESFVNIIKPLPESDSDEEGGSSKSGKPAQSSYSCLRCYLLQPEGIDTRSHTHTRIVSSSKKYYPFNHYHAYKHTKTILATTSQHPGNPIDYFSANVMLYLLSTVGTFVLRKISLFNRLMKICFAE